VNLPSPAAIFNTGAPHEVTNAGTVYPALRYEPIVAVYLLAPVASSDGAVGFLASGQINQRLFRSLAAGRVRALASEIIAIYTN
jgi:hypothetical protein